MQRASLNSPRDRAKNTKVSERHTDGTGWPWGYLNVFLSKTSLKQEEEHARENKKITKKLNEKEVAIYELSYELEEKNKQIDQMSKLLLFCLWP
jgi:hypothetical protein